MPTILPWSEPINWANPSEKETIVLMVRHGETFGNNSKDKDTYTYTGSQTDFPLNANGTQQAETLGNTLSQLQKEGALKVSKIFSSFLKRAEQTAESLKNALGLPSIEKRENLKEINWGEADGKLVADIGQKWDEKEDEMIEKYPDRKRQWDHIPVYPGAEKFNQLLERVTPEIERIGEANKGNVVIVVAHGRVLKTLTAESLNVYDDQVPYPQNCGAAVFRFTTGKPLEFIEVRANH